MRPLRRFADRVHAIRSSSQEIEAPDQPFLSAELEELGALQDNGVITPDEFEAENRQLLHQ